MFETRLPPKPAILNVIGIISVLWSLTTVLGVFVGVLVLLGLGAGSWLLGPAAGAVGSLLGLLGILWLIGASILSVILFLAGWRTLWGDPSGVRLHRNWAWISLVLDAVGLLISGGLYVGSWWGVLYAVGVLYVTRTPEVLQYVAALEGGWLVKPAQSLDPDF